MLDNIESVVRSTFDPEAARALETLRESSDEARAGLESGPEPFLRDLARLMLVSPPMLETLERHPDWIGWLRARAESAAPAAELAPGDDLDAARAYKRREYLDIAFRDIAGLASFDETVIRLSELADALVGWCLGFSWRQLAAERPADLDAEPDGFAVFALGKLGGRELNYSSDVDLVFLRRPEREEDPTGSEAELRFFTRLGERLIQALSQAGPDGFLYRVDMRLRPYGDSGALVPTVSSLVDYYDSWSEAWERQALVKARFVAGAGGLGERFAEFAQQFLFARPMDDAALEELKRVKHRAEREYATTGPRVHVKQGPGGIRDIEFYVQFLQLVAGPNHPEVRGSSTLDAIGRLAAARMLLAGEESDLAIAYRFLRIVEHRLQLRSLTPNALLPEDPHDVEALARGLGFEDKEAAARFRAVLAQHRSRVRAILERIYLTPGYLHLPENEAELAQLLSERTPRDRAREILAQYGFRDLDRAWQNVRLLAVGPAGRILPPAERRAFLGVAFKLLEVLRDSLDPDQALHHLESFASATGNRVSFLRSLAAAPAHLLRVANLVALSTHAHQVLVRHPEYFDTIARGYYVGEGRTAAAMEAELLERLRTGPQGGVADSLRRFRQRETLRVAYRDISELADPLQVSSELTDLGEACLRAALARVGSDSGETPELIVLGLGKLGSRQMHYASDFDLVFLYDDPPGGLAPPERARLARALDARVEQILELLGGVTAEGVAYRVDLRLRPEGASGLLARSYASFIQYAEQYMKPWERMALVRSRVVAPPGAAERWRELHDRVVYRFGWDSAALESIRHVKRRIEAETRRESSAYLDFKHGHGGIADIEFLVQMLQVLHGARAEAVRVPNTGDAIAALERAGALLPGEAAELAAAHRFERHVENHFQLMEEWVAREISRESPQLVRLARSLGLPSGDPTDVRRAFLAEWERHAGAVRRLVEKYFYGPAVDTGT